MDRRVLAWAAYDVANSSFATAVLAGFFPLFFTRVYAAGQPVVSSGFRLGLTGSIVGVAVAVSAPLLGAVADRRGSRKRFLLFATLLGASATAALAFVPRGAWLPALLLFGVAATGFSGGMTFYDALLLEVAPPERSERASAFGYALGYLGGGLFFLVCVVAYARPGAFGLADGEAVVRAAFLATAAWWLLFSLPLFRVVPETRPAVVTPVGRALRLGAREVWTTLRRLGHERDVGLFLLAYWLYIDGLDTIVRMALYFGQALGLPSQHLVRALLVTQFVGFPATVLFGRLGERFGAKRGVLAGLAVYVVVTVAATRIETAAHFYALAVAVGLVQGAVQSLSRSLFARLVPRERSAEYFGFYNMLGKFAVVLGPFLMGATGRVTGEARTSILAVLVLFLAGGGLLLFVRVDGEEHVARSRAS